MVLNLPTSTAGHCRATRSRFLLGPPPTSLAMWCPECLVVWGATMLSIAFWGAFWGAIAFWGATMLCGAIGKHSESPPLDGVLLSHSRVNLALLDVIVLKAEVSKNFSTALRWTYCATTHRMGFCSSGQPKGQTTRCNPNGRPPECLPPNPSIASARCSSVTSERCTPMEDHQLLLIGVHQAVQRHTKCGKKSLKAREK